MRIIGLIPARGGSKSIPRKNVKPIAGKPLIAWTIEAALRAERLSAVIVTTDDEEIAAIARAFGAQVPFLRPPEIARDDTPGIEPVLHALDMLSDTDAVLALQPTSPLRTTADIDACLALGAERQAPVVSVSPPATHPHWMYELRANQELVPLLDTPTISRRQDLPPVYALNGALYYAQTGVVRAHRSFMTPNTLGFIMPPDRSIDVDTALDWHLAELLLNDRR